MFRNLVPCLVGTLIFIFVLETVFRLFPTPFREEFLNHKFQIENRNRASVTFSHPILGKWNKPNSEGVLRRREYTVHVRINSQGLRGPEKDHRKPPSRYRILFLGDSFTFGTGVEEEESFVRLVEDRLGPQVETINGSAPGVSTRQLVHFLKEEGIKYSPDLVILCLFQNDIQDNSLEVLQQTRPEEVSAISFFLYRLSGKTGWLLDEALFGRSALYASVRYLKRNYLFPYTLSDSEFEPTRKSIQEMKEFCDQKGIPFAVVYIPRREELQKRYSEKMTSAYLERYCQEDGIPFLDLWKAFRDLNDRPSLYFPLDTHFSRYGHHVTARRLREFLLNQVGISQERSLDPNLQIIRDSKNLSE